MALFEFVSGGARGFLGSIIDRRMNAALDAGLEASRAAAPVRTGHLKSLVGGHYDQEAKVVTLYGDASYTAPQELGFTTRSGRKVPGRHFLAAGLAAMGRTWGGTTAVQFTHAPAASHAKTTRITGGKIGKAKLILGHRRRGG